MSPMRQAARERTAQLQSSGQAFYGATYLWPTPNHGPRPIGVANPSGRPRAWCVGWYDDAGKFHLVNSRLSRLPSAQHAQDMLTLFAVSRGLANGPGATPKARAS